MARSKATVEKLNALHGALAEYFLDVLDSGEELSGGTLAAINTFLKTNDITVDLTESNPLQNLQAKLRDMVVNTNEEVA